MIQQKKTVEFTNFCFPVTANLRTLKQNNDQGINVSPRDQPPPVETRFEITADQPYLSPRQGANIQTSPVQGAGT